MQELKEGLKKLLEEKKALEAKIDHVQKALGIDGEEKPKKRGRKRLINPLPPETRQAKQDFSGFRNEAREP